MKKTLLLVVAVCGGFFTWGQCLPTYSYDCTSGDMINSVVFNTISNTGTGCPNPSVNNYSNYTAMTTNVQQNTSYTIDVTPGPSWGQYFAVYIDFNNDLDFNDAGEFFDVGYANSGTTISAPIMIPNGIPGGPTIMRVLCRYGSSALTSTDGCATGLSFGECEDYTLNIASPLTDDAGISAFVTPSLPTCSFTDSIRVALTNYGTDPLTSVNISWTLNGGTPTVYPWTGSLAPFASETVTLGLVPLASGDNLVATTNTPNGVVEDPLGAWNDMSDIASLEAGLSGTKTIGGASPDYIDFASAITAINTFGLCGSVIFDIRDGIYNDQIDLVNTPTDALNNITFRSENGDPSLVTLSFAGAALASNFIVSLNNSDYITFEDLTFENTGATYGTVISIQNGSDNNSFDNCHFHTVTSNTTSTNTAVIYSPSGSIDNNNVFTNNTIQGGSYGLYWYGGGLTTLESGTVFDNNTFLDNYYYGARFDYQDAPVITNNKLIGESTYTGIRYGIYINYCDNGFTLTGNTLAGTLTTGWRYGMYILNSDATNANHAKLSNNMVQVGQDGNTSVFYGIYMSNNGFIDVEHNSVFISSGGGTSRALYVTGGGGNTLTNNMLVNYTAGHALYLGSAYSLVSSDYNLIHSPGGSVGYLNGDLATLVDWQNTSGGDMNSIDLDPIFHSTYDLHVCNNAVKGLGTPIAAITMDVDGQMRDAVAPDMGADEFSDLSGDFLGADIEVCAGEMVILSAGAPSDTVLWSTGETTNSIDGTTPGTYSVDIISACGNASDTIIVTASAAVYTDFLIATEMEFCAGDDVVLSSNSMFDTYAWTGGSTSNTLTVTSGGTYTLDVTDACGTGTQSLVITENDVPNAAFTWMNSFVTGVFTNTSVATGSSTTYSWDFGDGNTSTEMNPTHVYATTGTFTVTLTVTNDCGTDTFTSDVVMTSVGMEEIAGLGTIAVYPNPSSGIFQLDVNLNETMALDIVVINMLGEEVAVQKINAMNGVSSDMIDLTASAPGMYFLKIISDNNTISTQVLVKK